MFRLWRVGNGLSQEQLPFDAIQLWFPQVRPLLMRCRQRLGQQAQPFFGLAALAVCFGQNGMVLWQEQRDSYDPQSGPALVHLGDALRSPSLLRQCPAVHDRP